MHRFEKFTNTKFIMCHFKYSISNKFAFVPWILTRNLLKCASLVLWWLPEKAGCTNGMVNTEHCRGDNSLFLYHFQHTKACIIHLKLLWTQEESSRRFSARIHKSEGESNRLSRFEKKRSLGLWRSSKRSIPLRLQMAEWAGRRAKPCCAFIKPCTAYIDEWAGEKLALGIRARWCKFGAQKA